MADHKGMWEKTFQWRIWTELKEHHQLFVIPASEETTIVCSAAFNLRYDEESREPTQSLSLCLHLADKDDVRLTGHFSVTIRSDTPYGGDFFEATNFDMSRGKRVYLDGNPTITGTLLRAYVCVSVFSREVLAPPAMSMREFGSPLLGSEDFSDVAFECGGRTFKCHAVVLAGRSEVFQRMLTSGFKEAKERRIEITNLEPSVLEHLIKFVYEDAVDEGAISWDLFDAAKLYEIPRLAHLCLESLRKNLGVDSCARMLEAAFLHGMEETFDYAMAFFSKNKSEVARSEGWEAVMNNKDLMNKIILHPL